ncbi:MAG TPA: response regulator [Labilithrix sp.]|nr:response regulator [Labilithrix sp.]
MTISHSNYVLLVDDDEDIRATVEVALEYYGFEAITLGDGAEALEWLHAGNAPPFLILLDFMMPNMGGLQFRQAQQNAPLLRTIPTVILTGASELPPEHASLVGTEVLRKPIALQDLVATVRRHAPQARSADPASR